MITSLKTPHSVLDGARGWQKQAQTIWGGWCRTGKWWLMLGCLSPHHSSLWDNSVLFCSIEEAAFWVLKWKWSIWMVDWNFKNNKEILTAPSVSCGVSTSHHLHSVGTVEIILIRCITILNKKCIASTTRPRTQVIWIKRQLKGKNWARARPIAVIIKSMILQCI